MGYFWDIYWYFPESRYISYINIVYGDLSFLRGSLTKLQQFSGKLGCFSFNKHFFGDFCCLHGSLTKLHQFDGKLGCFNLDWNF